MTSRLGLASLLILSLGLRAHGLEVSIEENKAERGNIGYVDLQRVFRLFPETEKAKQNFEEVLRQAEEQVSLRKAELVGLRAELLKLRYERELVSKAPMNVAPNPAPAPKPEDAILGGLGVAKSTAAVAASTTAAPTDPDRAAASTAAASVAVSTGTDPGESAVPASTAPVAASVPGPPAPVPPPAPLIINLPGLSDEPVVLQAPGVGGTSASLAELDARIAEKGRVLQEKEAEFKTYQGQVEKNLLDLEGRKTEVLLGKIYAAVQEVARDEGVSVVVDKGQILFGHRAVDLTDKVLKRLGKG